MIHRTFYGYGNALPASVVTSSTRVFTTSASLWEESKFLIDGIEFTRTQVLEMEPQDRQIAHWRLLVDWDLQRQRPYVIVDPLDPAGLLYLTLKEYLAQAKVAASTDFTFIVIARPGTTKPQAISRPNTSHSSSSSFSKNSPWGVRLDRKMSSSEKFSFSTFNEFRNRIHLLVSKAKPEAKMVSETTETIVRTVLVWARTVAHYAEVKNQGTVPFYLVSYALYLRNLLKNNGSAAVVTHLKVALFALYSYISGNPLKSTISLGIGIRLDRSGLPVCWGRIMRDLVRKGDISYTRLMASVLNMYRAMEAPHGKPSIASIIKPLPEGFHENETFREFRNFCESVWPELLAESTGLTGNNLCFEYKTGLGYLIRTAGANHSGPAMGALGQDALAWKLQPHNHIKEWFEMHEDDLAVKLMNLAEGGRHFGQPNEPEFSRVRSSLMFMATRNAFSSRVSFEFPIMEDGTPQPILGRLHAIDEPAGKVRVVAICDYWTQIGMKSVHDHLFNILRRIETDATFNQIGIVDRYFKQGFRPHWSFDLKAATDSIPLPLYIEVLTPILRSYGEDLATARRRAELWAKVMTDRDFLDPLKEGYARYGTGQPMGALSSWASMALVHHALVQFAHYQAMKSDKDYVYGHSTGKPYPWFRTYLVLGDDIDIACKSAVAERYQSICSDLGIVIGLLKSLRSETNCFEFANQRFSPDGNISPISLKEELSAQTWVARTEYAKRILARFGTSYSNPGLALLRKATTAPQWDALVPELTGERRVGGLVQISTFLLQNPFTFTGGWPTIGSLMEWLALLGLGTQKLANLPENQGTLFELSMTYALDLITRSLAEAKERIDSFPTDLYGKVVLDKDETLDQLKEHINIPIEELNKLIAAGKVSRTALLMRGFKGDPITYPFLLKQEGGRPVFHLTLKDFPSEFGKIIRRMETAGVASTVSESPVFWYVLYCIKQENTRTRDRLIAVANWLTLLKALLEHKGTRGLEMSITDFLNMTLTDLEDLPVTIGEGSKRRSWPTEIKSRMRMTLCAAFSGIPTEQLLEKPELVTKGTLLDLIHWCWAELKRLPHMIVPDFNAPISDWLREEVQELHPYMVLKNTRGANKVLRVIEERVRGPLYALAGALARTCGICVPDLPFIAFEATYKKGETWFNFLRRHWIESRWTNLCRGFSSMPTAVK